MVIAKIIDGDATKYLDCCFTGCLEVLISWEGLSHAQRVHFDLRLLTRVCNVFQDLKIFRWINSTILIIASPVKHKLLC